MNKCFDYGRFFVNEVYCCIVAFRADSFEIGYPYCDYGECFRKIKKSFRSRALCAKCYITYQEFSIPPIVDLRPMLCSMLLTVTVTMTNDTSDKATAEVWIHVLWLIISLVLVVIFILIRQHRARYLLALLIANLLELAHLSRLSALTNDPYPVHTRLLTLPISINDEDDQARHVLKLDEPQIDPCR